MEHDSTASVVTARASGVVNDSEGLTMNISWSLVQSKACPNANTEANHIIPLRFVGDLSGSFVKRIMFHWAFFHEPSGVDLILSHFS